MWMKNMRVLKIDVLIEPCQVSLRYANLCCFRCVEWIIVLCDVGVNTVMPILIVPWFRLCDVGVILLCLSLLCHGLELVLMKKDDGSCLVRCRWKERMGVVFLGVEIRILQGVTLIQASQWLHLSSCVFLHEYRVVPHSGEIPFFPFMDE